MRSIHTFSSSCPSVYELFSFSLSVNLFFLFFPISALAPAVSNPVPTSPCKLKESLQMTTDAEMITISFPPLERSTTAVEDDAASDSLTPMTPILPSPEFPSSSTRSFPLPHFAPLPCTSVESSRVRDNPLSVPDRRYDTCPTAADVLGDDVKQKGSKSKLLCEASSSAGKNSAFLPLSSQNAMSGSGESSCSTVHSEEQNYSPRPRR